MDADFTLRRFGAGSNADGSADPQTLAWLESTAIGFLGDPLSPEHAARTVESFQRDDRVLTGVHDPTASRSGWAADHPVATFATLRKTLNVGGGRLIPAHLIADVTVLATHRGRGLLRRMMEDDLGRAAADGLPVAALYGADAGLYTRYGFGPATRTQRAEVDVRRMRFTRTPSGTVVVVDPDALREAIPAVDGELHRTTLGSVQRLASHAAEVCGQWPQHPPGPHPTVRGALHVSDGGVPDGYVTFRFRGWGERPLAIDVVALVALTPDAHLGLWGHLAAQAPAEVVRIENLPPDDPLPWLLADRRAMRVVGEQDGVWLRILDPEVCLRERLHDATGDPLTLRVHDELGICPGAYRIVPASRGTEVTKVPDGAADAVLDADALASLFLGGYTAASLERAGRIRGAAPGVVARLDRLFGSGPAPYTDTHF